jgi:Tfp pilus assembly pilus retraction ATPase PilT
MGQMIKFEHGMLVLNSLMTKEDVAAINEFADYVRNQENERIIKLLEEMPWQIYQAVALDGKILESVSMPKVLNRDDVLALIKGDKLSGYQK